MGRQGASIGALGVILFLTSVTPASATTTVGDRPATAAASASWSNWEPLARGLPLAQPPVATSMQPLRLDVFAVGPDESDWDVWYDLTGWHQTSLGSHTNADLAGVTNPSYPGYIDLYERTIDNGHGLSVSLYNNSSP